MDVMYICMYKCIYLSIYLSIHLSRWKERQKERRRGRPSELPASLFAQRRPRGRLPLLVCVSLEGQPSLLRANRRRPTLRIDPVQQTSTGTFPRGAFCSFQLHTGIKTGHNTDVGLTQGSQGGRETCSKF